MQTNQRNEQLYYEEEEEKIVSNEFIRTTKFFATASNFRTRYSKCGIFRLLFFFFFDVGFHGSHFEKRRAHRNPDD